MNILMPLMIIKVKVNYDDVHKENFNTDSNSGNNDYNHNHKHNHDYNPNNHNDNRNIYWFLYMRLDYVGSKIINMNSSIS